MQWRIALAQTSLLPMIHWFHVVLGHTGSKRLCLTLQTWYYHPQLCGLIDRFVCDTCQCHKLAGPGYGQFPERDIREAPWEEVAIDLIGPWTVNI